MPVFGPIHVGEQITIKANPTDSLGARPARIVQGVYSGWTDIAWEVTSGSETFVSKLEFPTANATCKFTGSAVGNAVINLRAMKPSGGEVITPFTIQVIAAVIPGPGEVDHFEPEVV